MGKVTISKTFTSTTLFSGEDFTATSGATSSSILNISRYNHILFYAQADTGTISFAATITAEVSPDGTNFFPYSGFLNDDNISNTGSSAISLSTASSSIFEIRNIGDIHSIRFTLTMINHNASTSVDLFFSARTND